MNNDLRVVAISAPEFPFGRNGTRSLGGRDPVSLYNASRYAASLAERGSGAWGRSNWVGNRHSRRNKFLLMSSMEEDRVKFIELLEKERPNLLLLGAMTICMPGAIECAKLAKQILGDDVLIVLGGKHVNETMYRSRESKDVCLHPASPLKLMSSSIIPPVFDLFVSGEAEMVIAEIGEVVARNNTKTDILRDIQDKKVKVDGDWIIGYVLDGVIKFQSGSTVLKKETIPSHLALFGTQTRFDIFPGTVTGQLFSHVSMGCSFDCYFCSERKSVNYGVFDKNSSPKILANQMAECVRVIAEDFPQSTASAFVEDSILLGGSRPLIEKLIKIRKMQKDDLTWGCQFTLDLASKNMDIMTDLREIGLGYVFVGLETVSEDIARNMSKNISKQNWVTVAEQVIKDLSDRGIQTGVALLFGLGETQQERLRTIDIIAHWKQKYDNPKVVSFNWAVKHPLQNATTSKQYLYLDWGIRDPEFISAFRDFGEASCAYPMDGVAVPSLSEIKTLKTHLKSTLSL